MSWTGSPRSGSGGSFRARNALATRLRKAGRAAEAATLEAERARHAADEAASRKAAPERALAVAERHAGEP